eukprot:4861903-Pyramimonas_sp.AAC.1
MRKRQGPTDKNYAQAICWCETRRWHPCAGGSSDREEGSGVPSGRGSQTHGCPSVQQARWPGPQVANFRRVGRSAGPTS